MLEDAAHHGQIVDQYDRAIPSTRSPTQATIRLAEMGAICEMRAARQRRSTWYTHGRNRRGLHLINIDEDFGAGKIKRDRRKRDGVRRAVGVQGPFFSSAPEDLDQASLRIDQNIFL